MVFPIALVCVIIWIVIVYLVGSAVQKRTQLRKIGGRVGVSFVCSLMAIMIFPVSVLIDDYIRWNKLYLEHFLDNCTDVIAFIILAIHFFVFWIGEEMQWLETRMEKDTDK